MEPLKIGLCGLGTVGSGTYNVLQRNAEEITRRVGKNIQVSHIGARRDNPNCNLSNVRVSRDIFNVVKDPEINIIVELIGGCEVALELVMQAIANGKHVVTANKALIAMHGNEIFAEAEKQGINVAFEAAVAGGIPIIKTIREGLSANRIEWLAGIINGTSNFILTEMYQKQRSFEDVLKEAQELGYAEADPTFDIDGTDAAHKLTILASIAFGIPLQFNETYIEGITEITPEDMVFADEFGYRIKHLGLTCQTETGIELRVHPSLIPKKQLMANVNDVTNAVMVQGDAVGPTVYCGAGAGAEPTASAVIADIIDVARTLTTNSNNRVPYLGFQSNTLVGSPILNVEDITTAYYLRIHAMDRLGVMADVTRILSENNISIEALMQNDNIDTNSQQQVPIVLLTHQVKEKQINQAIMAIEALNDINGSVMRIRVESLAD